MGTVGEVRSYDEVAEVALGLPEVEEGTSRGWRTWKVAGKQFAWERPFSKADIRRFGEENPPAGPILALRVEDLAEKEAILQAGDDGVFTIPHFDGYASVLVQLDVVDAGVLRELLVDAWLAVAPTKLAREFVDGEQRPSGD